MAASAGKIYCRLPKSKSKLALFANLNIFRKDGIALRYVANERQMHSSASYLATIKLDMPSLSPTMEKGNIIKWYKKEGKFTSILGQEEMSFWTCLNRMVWLFDLLVSTLGGLVVKLVPADSKDVPIGSLIALLVEEGDDWKNVQIPAEAAAKPPSKPATETPTPVVTTAAVPASPPSAALSSDHGDHRHLVGPSVKKLLQEYNISSNDVPATGPAGALLKGDVLNYINSKKLSKSVTPPAASTPSTPAPKVEPAAAPGANYIDIPLTSMRRTIAKRLTESKSTIPHAYASIDSNMGALTELRKTLAADGVKISVNDFIVKAAALALQRSPKVNAIWANDGPKLSQSVDISVAVATPNGLITPIVKGASYLSVEQISSTVKELSGRAKEGKLLPHEYQGGSFSISNLGMFGITEFSAVINPPQLAILAIGTSRTEASMKGNQLKMTVTLSYDSRGLNEVEATRFLEEFRNALENPQFMLGGTNLDSAAEAFAF
uniref:Peripheral subunit-binding (PSBD) domain-containing protein n=1 Tax=Biomphalaria glabrata TaxID=6526 RepID=A0A2C9JLQ2_BIOGL